MPHVIHNIISHCLLMFGGEEFAWILSFESGIIPNFHLRFQEPDDDNK